MTASHIEIERKFELPDGAALPDLGLGGGIVRAAPRELSLRAAYYDTDDLVLARAQVTLRRRQGGDDDGWHLKLPAGTDRRREVHRPIGRTSVPAPLRGALTPLTLKAPLRQVVEVRTTRTVHLLTDRNGHALAEVAEDDVSVVRAASPDAPVGWQEVEVELVGGDLALLDEVTKRLKAAGARTSDHPSKLRRALGDDLPPWHTRPAGLRRRDAGAALWNYLAAQIEHLAKLEVEVRLGMGDGVHQMRIAARRLRTALSVFRPLLDPQTARHLEAELRWLGQELSEVRDLEVMRERLLAAIAVEPSSPPVRAMASAVRAALRADEQTARRSARTALDSERHIQLQVALEQLLGDPPFSARAANQASKMLDRQIGRSWQRFAERVAAADKADGPGHDDALHDVRKAAKRLRYAAELAESTLGKPARRLRARAQSVQKALGEHQDSVVAREWYQRLGADATSAAVAFGFGRLHALEQLDAADFENAYTAAVAELRSVSSLR